MQSKLITQAHVNAKEELLDVQDLREVIANHRQRDVLRNRERFLQKKRQLTYAKLKGTPKGKTRKHLESLQFDFEKVNQMGDIYVQDVVAYDSESISESADPQSSADDAASSTLPEAYESSESSFDAPPSEDYNVTKQMDGPSTFPRSINPPDEGYTSLNHHHHGNRINLDSTPSDTHSHTLPSMASEITSFSHQDAYDAPFTSGNIHAIESDVRFASTTATVHNGDSGEQELLERMRATAVNTISTLSVDQLASVLNMLGNEQSSNGSATLDTLDSNESISESFTGTDLRKLNSSISSPPAFPLPTSIRGRDWNAEFQSLLNHIYDDESVLDGAQWFTELSELHEDFVYTAKTIGRILISEKYVKDSLKTIKPTKLGGRAGGLKFVQHSIVFKFATQDESTSLSSQPPLYSTDVDAMASANHELLGVSQCFRSILTLKGLDVHVPLACVIDFRGFRLWATCALPINKTTLVMGSDDEGRSIRNDDPVISAKIARIASLLNISGHYVQDKQGFKTHLYGPFDLEVHKGTDGRIYLLDFHRLFPCEPPAAAAKFGITAVNPHLYRLLRPELVRNNPVPLSSDAFLNGSDRESMDAVTSCFNRLVETIIPAFAAQLDTLDSVDQLGFLGTIQQQQMESLIKKMVGFSKSSARPIINRSPIVQRNFSNSRSSSFSGSLTNGSGVSIVQYVHQAGINLRYLGLIRTYVKSKHWKDYLLVEMIARYLKNELRRRCRDRMKQIKYISDSPFRRCAIDFINLVFHSQHSKSSHYWRTEIQAKLNRKFPFALTAAEQQPSVDLRTLLIPPSVITSIRWNGRNPSISLALDDENNSDLLHSIFLRFADLSGLILQETLSSREFPSFPKLTSLSSTRLHDVHRRLSVQSISESRSVSNLSGFGDRSIESFAHDSSVIRSDSDSSDSIVAANSLWSKRENSSNSISGLRRGNHNGVFLLHVRPMEDVDLIDMEEKVTSLPISSYCEGTALLCKCINKAREGGSPMLAAYLAQLCEAKFQESLQYCLDDTLTLCNYSMLYSLYYNDSALAKQLLLAALHSNRNHHRSLYYLAQIEQYHIGDYDTARWLYIKALTIHPTHANNYKDYGNLLFYAYNDVGNAEKAYRYALHLHPDHIKALIALAVLLSKKATQLSDFDAVIDLFRAAAHSLYGDARTREFAIEKYLQFLQARAEIYADDDALENARKVYQECLEYRPFAPTDPIEDEGPLNVDLNEDDEKSPIDSISSTIQKFPPSAALLSYAHFLRKYVRDVEGARKIYLQAVTSVLPESSYLHTLPMPLSDLGITTGSMSSPHIHAESVATTTPPNSDSASALLEEDSMPELVSLSHQIREVRQQEVTTPVEPQTVSNVVIEPPVLKNARPNLNFLILPLNSEQSSASQSASNIQPAIPLANAWTKSKKWLPAPLEPTASIKSGSTLHATEDDGARTIRSQIPGIPPGTVTSWAPLPILSFSPASTPIHSTPATSPLSSHTNSIAEITTNTQTTVLNPITERQRSSISEISKDNSNSTYSTSGSANGNTHSENKFSDAILKDINYHQSREKECIDTTPIRAYAEFLRYNDENKDHAEHFYKLAIILCPYGISGSLNKCFYADFLGRVRFQQHDALVLYESAIESPLVDVRVYRMYANFVRTFLNDKDRANQVEQLGKSVRQKPYMHACKRMWKGYQCFCKYMPLKQLVSIAHGHLTSTHGGQPKPMNSGKDFKRKLPSFGTPGKPFANSTSGTTAPSINTNGIASPAITSSASLSALPILSSRTLPRVEPNSASTASNSWAAKVASTKPKISSVLPLPFIINKQK